jgi:hypothetical protein
VALLQLKKCLDCIENVGLISFRGFLSSSLCCTVKNASLVVVGQQQRGGLSENWGSEDLAKIGVWT